LPAKVTAGASDDRGAGAAAAVSVADGGTSEEAGVVAGRGRTAAATFFLGCADGACGDVSRAKSLPMLRVASHPDRSNSPTLTVCLITTLIVILAQHVS
jgi:hypothetical protein